MEDRTEALISVAKDLLRRGFQPVPVPPGEKGPRTPGWQNARLTSETVAAAFSGAGNIGVLCGEASGGLVDIDLDCPEAVRLAPEFLPETGMKSGRSARPGSHWWFRTAARCTKRLRDPVTNKTIVEYRSDGHQTLVAPSVHPETGDVYQPLEGEPAAVDPDHLLECVEKLHRAVVIERHGRVPSDTASPVMEVAASERVNVPSGAALKRAAAYLDAMPPAIAGQGGHDATYAAATSLVHGFELDPSDALRLLIERFNPRCVPPWSAKELEHKVEDTATKPHARPRGWLHAS